MKGKTPQIAFKIKIISYQLLSKEKGRYYELAKNQLKLENYLKKMTKVIFLTNKSHFSNKLIYPPLSCNLGKIAISIKNMSVIFILIGISISVALVFLGLFLWAVKSKQYEDDYTPSVRMLFDDELKK